MGNYIPDRKKRTKINIFYSSWQDILHLTRANISTSYFILFSTTFLYAIGETPDEVSSKLERKAKVIFQWFTENQMKAIQTNAMY